MGLNPILETRLGTELILKYPNVPDTSRFKRVMCDITHNSIFENPVITYNVFLLGIDQICPLKFQLHRLFSSYKFVPCPMEGNSF